MTLKPLKGTRLARLGTLYQLVFVILDRIHYNRDSLVAIKKFTSEDFFS